MDRWTGFGVALLCVGCLDFDPNRDAKTPGDALGTFQAVGALASDQCQADLLGVVNPWQFSVKLSRASDALYWLNGQEAIAGDLGSDGVSFTFDSGIEVTLAAPHGAVPGCIISRHDLASGELDAAGSDVHAFSADMSFGYAAKAGSDCSPWVGVPGGFAALPCSVAYRVAAERTAPAK